MSQQFIERHAKVKEKCISSWKVRPMLPTSYVQVFQVDTPRHNFKHGYVGDVGTSLALELSQFWASSSDGVQSFVG